MREGEDEDGPMPTAAPVPLTDMQRSPNGHLLPVSLQVVLCAMRCVCIS
jgi:hypothetical protein